MNQFGFNSKDKDIRGGQTPIQFMMFISVKDLLSCSGFYTHSHM